MVKRYLYTKFGIDMPDGFWENGFYGRTTDRRTTDVRMTTVALLCSSTSRAKNGKKSKIWNVANAANETMRKTFTFQVIFQNLITFQINATA